MSNRRRHDDVDWSEVGHAVVISSASVTLMVIVYLVTTWVWP